MHYEISTFRRTASSLVIGVALLMGMGLTIHAEQKDKALKAEMKSDKRELKTHQKDERAALKNHQREEREAFKQTAHSQKRGKTWKNDDWRNRNNDHSDRNRCIKGCKQAHKNALRACRGRIGRDRSACERAANRAHRRCHASCRVN